MSALASTPCLFLVPGTAEHRAFRRRAAKWLRRARRVPVPRASVRALWTQIAAHDAAVREEAQREKLAELRDTAAELAGAEPTPALLLVKILTAIIAGGRQTATQTATIDRLFTALATPEPAASARPLPPGGSYSIALLVDVLGVGDPKGAKRWLDKRGVPMIRAGRNYRVLAADLERKAALEWRTAVARYERG